MNREYHKWYSHNLGRNMEMLIQGHAGRPFLVFPTSMGKYFEFEDRGMTATLAGKLDSGQLQLFCIDSVDSESWYNRSAHPATRVARHLQYEKYVLDEVLPLIHQKNPDPQITTTGCSFGAYHALNIALRHPDVIHGCVTMGGAFDIMQFLNGYYDDNCYFNCPTHFLPNMNDPWYFDRYRKMRFTLVTGEHDMCWDANEKMAGIFRDKSIPHELFVWRDNTGHDWPWWNRMAAVYLP